MIAEECGLSVQPPLDLQESEAALKGEAAAKGAKRKNQSKSQLLKALHILFLFVICASQILKVFFKRMATPPEICLTSILLESIAAFYGTKHITKKILKCPPVF